MGLALRHLSDASKSIELSMDEMYAFDEAGLHLEERTGIYVDPYKDTRIHPEHQKLLAAYLTEHTPESGGRIARFLVEALELGVTLLAEGD